jgi:hypothetical protein
MSLMSRRRSTIRRPTVAMTCKRSCEPDTSEGRGISRSSWLDDIEIERSDSHAVKPDLHGGGWADILSPYRAAAGTVAHTQGISAAQATGRRHGRP